MAQGDVIALRLRAQQTSGANAIENVLHYQITEVGGASDGSVEASRIATALSAVWNQHWKAYTPSIFTLQPVDYWGIDRPTIGGSAGDPIPGTLAANALLPFRSAVVVKKSSGMRGRRRQGRMYVGPVGEAHQEAGVIIAGYVANVKAYVDALKVLTGEGGTSAALCIDSPANPGAGRPDRIVSVVTEMQIRSNLGSQRGRQAVN